MTTNVLITVQALADSFSPTLLTELYNIFGIVPVVEYLVAFADDLSATELDAYRAIHTFFERILIYQFCRSGSTWNEFAQDTFAFILYELFLYAVASMIKNERCEAIRLMINRGYYLTLTENRAVEPGVREFTVFSPYIGSLDHRNKRLKLIQASIISRLIRDRATRSDLRFEDLMQADFVLFLCSEL